LAERVRERRVEGVVQHVLLLGPVQPQALHVADPLAQQHVRHRNPFPPTDRRSLSSAERGCPPAAVPSTRARPGERSTTMTERRTCPAIEFDHHSPELALDPWAVYKELREKCPVAHTDAWGGFKVVTRYRDVVTVAKDTETFSSYHDVDGTGNGYQGVTIPAPMVRSVPVEMDPPEHTKHRKLLAQ